LTPFDRRNRRVENGLPAMPLSTIIEHGKEEEIGNHDPGDNGNNTQNAIAGLAYLGQIREQNRPSKSSEDNLYYNQQENRCRQKAFWLPSPILLQVLERILGFYFPYLYLSRQPWLPDHLSREKDLFLRHFQKFCFQS